MPKKVYYNGDSQVIQALCQTTNDIIDSGGGGGSVVTITPTIATGTKTADYSINGVSGELYAPTPPTKTSDLQNDSGYITSSDVPTKTSDLQNDSGFVASSDVAILKDANNDITTTLTLADNKVTFENDEILLNNVTLKSDVYGSIAQTVIEGFASNDGETVALKAWNNIASGNLSMSGNSFDVEIGDKTLLPSPRVYTPSVTISGADVSVLCDVDGDDNPNTITFPKKSGTVALTSDLGDYLPLAGGKLTGSIKMESTAAAHNTTPTYLLTMDAFASGGEVKYTSCSEVTAGAASKVEGSAVSVNITAASGITISNASYKIGNIVTLSFLLNPFTAAANWSSKTIGKVASGSRPKNVIIYDSSFGSWEGIIRIDTSGTITCQTVAGGAVTTNYIGVTCCYAC